MAALQNLSCKTVTLGPQYKYWAVYVGIILEPEYARVSHTVEPPNKSFVKRLPSLEASTMGKLNLGDTDGVL